MNKRCSQYFHLLIFHNEPTCIFRLLPFLDLWVFNKKFNSDYLLPFYKNSMLKFRIFLFLLSNLFFFETPDHNLSKYTFLGSNFNTEYLCWNFEFLSRLLSFLGLQVKIYHNIQLWVNNLISSIFYFHITAQWCDLEIFDFFGPSIFLYSSTCNPRSLCVCLWILIHTINQEQKNVESSSIEIFVFPKLITD